MEVTAAMLKSGLFADIGADEVPALLACLQCRKVDFSRGDVIAYAGQPQKYVGLVLEGALSLAKENLQGQRMLLSVIDAGDSFGEMNAYSGSRVWPATIMAERTGSLLAIPIDRIVNNCEKRCHSHWTLIINLLKLVSRKSLTLNKALDYMGIKGIRRKVCAMLLEEMRKAGSDRFAVPMNRAQMADSFFVTRPALSRELGFLKAEGAIDFKGNFFEVKDAAFLQRTLELDV
ncbi:MAG TPA: Crp/Fnr family transcriptional regulator [Bacillota bacterium]|nr:Crp/Fnr family transcriptional regulator [Bacillota bacterium]HOG52563.1 Crp/Fnr family transcriptional regulator [Bacillota bacterium]